MCLKQQNSAIAWLLLVFCQVLACGPAFVSGAPVLAEDALPVDYQRDIKPLLRDKCFACHSALKVEGGLRLDAASLIAKGGDSGPGLIAGESLQSLIVERITADESTRMPPAEAGVRLSKEEVDKIKRWIATGANAPDEAIPQDPAQHWAFLPPVKPLVPVVNQAWVRNDIDHFVAAGHERAGVSATGETPRAMLLRRVALALTGLPPTPEELSEILADSSDEAFERAVDRYLASPRYGERWARHFMDIWRYSDPSGFGDEIRDGRHHVWRWRDWIVDSLNEDKGYDRMIVEMLAADELIPTDSNALRATGFLARNWYKFNRNVWLDNTVEHSSKAFLGLTMNCARCHDHKYDPFPQQAYYQLRAIFEPHDLRDDSLGVAGLNGETSVSGTLVRAYDAHQDRPTYVFQMGNENSPLDDNPMVPSVPEVLGHIETNPIDMPLEIWYPAIREDHRLAAITAAKNEVVVAEQMLHKSQNELLVARRALSDFEESQALDPDAEPPSSPPTQPEVLISDDFSVLEASVWTIENGDWAINEGRLRQSDGSTKQHRIVTKESYPKNFHAKLRLRITGGETYQSVGIGFDGNGQSLNSVYLSAAGDTLQFTRQGSNGQWEYPADGIVKTTIDLERDYSLELAVRDQLLNVYLDGEFKLAYSLPERIEGRFSLWAFSATVDFDDLQVSTLPIDFPMTGHNGTNPLPTKLRLQLEQELAQAVENHAKSRLKSAVANLEALEARVAAEMTKFGLSAGDLSSLTLQASQLSRQHAVDLLREQIAKAELQRVELQLSQKPPAEAEALDKQLAELRGKLIAAEADLSNVSSHYEPLGVQYPQQSSGRRLAYARWITGRENPLTARVLVNHVWLRHFDSALVESTFDFGLRSERPQHHELLDWLAVEFMEGGWSLKKLHKQIVMSGLYRLRSAPTESARQSAVIDPDNKTYWRMNVRRMEAEVVRDSVLGLGGSLDMTMGGEPIDHEQGQDNLRRSLYFRQDKERQMTFLALFDGAKVNECYERKSTVVPQQALAMFNSRLASTQAEKISRMYTNLPARDFVSAVYLHVLCREASENEMLACLKYLSEFSDSPSSRWQLTLVVLNHNDFVTIR